MEVGDKKPKAYSYLRFSTADQAKGDSYRRQLALAEDYARTRGLDLDRSLSFEDLGVSAFSGRNKKRGALKLFLDAVEEDIIPAGSFLLVESLDRISREAILDAQGTFLMIVNAGITLVTLKGDTVEPHEVIVTALAMFLMHYQEPRRFKSDDAFTTQLVRRVRGLSDVNVGEWYDDKSGRTRRVYRELPPRVVQVIAGWLIPMLGGIGLKLVELEQAEWDARQQEIRSFYKAVSDLT
ncbi:recombinase family protein [Microvirga pudoricolor]|uniref:recombinase family protein n=1 Tax=Microvirga pudoricolor TaxID=2778729 RepID=UPI00194FE1D0|nr:recombinase family protein [Microvirga pudoricolor]MBM6592391.1 recombinase family protein [Microvirga pudoricolor]